MYQANTRIWSSDWYRGMRNACYDRTRPSLHFFNISHWCSRQKMCKIRREAQWPEYFHYVLQNITHFLLSHEISVSLWSLRISESTKYLHNQLNRCRPFGILFAKYFFISTTKLVGYRFFVFVHSHSWGRSGSYVVLLSDSYDKDTN